MVTSSQANTLNRKHTSEFVERMSFRAKTVTKNSNAIVEKAARAAFEELIFRTPIDTGDAKSNWTMTFNKAGSSVRKARVPGRYGSTLSENVFAALEYMEGRLAGYNGETIFIQNSLPYIQRLNAGYSEQAPAGFVEAAMLVGRYAVRGSKILDIR